MAKYWFCWSCIVFFLPVIDPNSFGLVLCNHLLKSFSEFKALVMLYVFSIIMSFKMCHFLAQNWAQIFTWTQALTDKILSNVSAQKNWARTSIGAHKTFDRIVQVSRIVSVSIMLLKTFFFSFMNGRLFLNFALSKYSRYFLWNSFWKYIALFPNHSLEL